MEFEFTGKRRTRLWLVLKEEEASVCLKPPGFDADLLVRADLWVPSTDHDPAGGLRYVNCGHLCALLLRRDGTLDRLEPTSPVLGLFRQWECSVGESCLESDDLLALYTDGVTEAFDDGGEEFGERRLVDALRWHRDSPPDALLASLVAEVRSFSPHEQHDDLTLIVARRRSA